MNESLLPTILAPSYKLTNGKDIKREDYEKNTKFIEEILREAGHDIIVNSNVPTMGFDHTFLIKGIIELPEDIKTIFDKLGLTVQMFGSYTESSRFVFRYK